MFLHYLLSAFSIDFRSINFIHSFLTLIVLLCIINSFMII